MGSDFKKMPLVLGMCYHKGSWKYHSPLPLYKYLCATLSSKSISCQLNEWALYAAAL